MGGTGALRVLPSEALAYWEDLFARFVKTPSWRKYLDDYVLVEAFLRGAELNRYVDEYSESIRGILRDGGVKVVR